MIRLLLALSIVLGISATAHASRALVFDVPATGGVYEVPVHPAFLTVFYFPSPVKSAYAQSHGAFTLHQTHAAITIQTDPGATGVANILAVSESFRVGVVLRVVSESAQAAITVDFRSLDVEQAFRQRVAEQVERELEPQLDQLNAERAKLQQRMRRLEQMIAFRGRRRMLDSMVRRHTHVDVNAKVRSRDHMIVRVRRLIWIGHDAYLDFEVQNRSAHPYELAVEIRYGATMLASMVALARSEDAGRALIVPAGGRERGMVSIPNAADWIGQSVVMKVRDLHDQERSASVTVSLRE